MAALFLSGCASSPKQPVAIYATSQLAMTKAKLVSARTAPLEKREKLLVETEKSLDSATCAVEKLSKTLQDTDNKAQKLKESTDYWQNKHVSAVGKLNFWRALFFGILAINFSVAAAAFAVSRIKLLSVL